MSTDPKRARGDGSERRASGAESKDEDRADPGGNRTKAGGGYGDWVPDRGQPRRNDDRDAQPPLADGAGAGDVNANPRSADAASPQARPDPRHDDPGRASSAEASTADTAERAAESNRNKDFDTPHVHSSTTSRKV